MNPTSTMRMQVQSLASLSELRIGSGISMNWGVGGRQGSDLVWLWPWLTPVAAGLIQPLTWIFPYAAPVALKDQKKKKRRDHALLILLFLIWCHYTVSIQLMFNIHTQILLLPFTI